MRPISRPGKRKVLAAYEHRVGTEVRHPLFGYKLCYRRVMEVQARLLSRVLSGEIAEYPPFIRRLWTWRGNTITS